MLENQKHFFEYTEKVEKAISPVSVMMEKGEQDYSQMEKLKKLQQEIKDIELIVPIVGGFSAGKSSLINSFLGGDILPIGIQPETALPAELRYSTTDYIEAVTANKRVDKYKLSDFEIIKQKVKSEEYRYLKVYLNNQNLKAIQPLVLVDMPGYSSPVLGHNDVIMDYTAKGLFFIFLSSVETQGTIQGNILDELAKVNEISKGFAFCLSKTNLKPASQVAEIRDEIIEKLEDEIDNFDGNIVLLDNNSGENLRKIVQSINPNELIKKVFLEKLKDNYDDNEKKINHTINSLKLDEEELKTSINEIKEGIDKIEKRKEEAKKEVENQNVEQATNLIINRINKVVTEQARYLAQVAIKSQCQFQEELNTLVKNNIEAELQKYLKEMNDKVIYDFQAEVSSLNFSKEFDPRFIDDIVAKIQRDIQKSDTSMDFNDINKILSMLSGLIPGVLGTIIKQVLSIINQIPFVGSILNSLFGSSNNDERYKAEAAREEALYKIENMIAGDILKSITSALKNQIPAVLKRALTQMVATIANEFDQKFKETKSTQDAALNAKQQNQEMVQKNIKQLEDLSSQLTQLKQQYLK